MVNPQVVRNREMVGPGGVMIIRGSGWYIGDDSQQ